MNNKLIGKYISEKRKSLNKTQKEIADSLGVTYQAVSRWETGESIPDIETLCMLADLYNVSVDTILRRKTEPRKIEFEVENMMWVMVLVSTFAYIIGYLTYRFVDAIWIREAAILCYVMFTLGGILPPVIYYFSESWNSIHRKAHSYWFLGSFIALLISIVFVVIG